MSQQNRKVSKEKKGRDSTQANPKQRQDRATESLQIPAEDSRDNLMQIPGIDQQKELALNKLGILRFKDFEGFSAEQLSEYLEQETGMFISPGVIREQDWIGVAETLSREESSAKPSENKYEKGTEKIPESHARDDSDKVSHEVQLNATVPIARHETMLKKHVVESTKSKQAVDKSKKQKKQTVMSPGGTDWPIPAESVEKEKNGSLEITHMKFTKTKPSSPNRSFPQKLMCSLVFKVNGSISKMQPIPCSAQVFALNEKMNESRLLSHKPLVIADHESVYRLNLEFEAPTSGNHRLQTVIFSQQASPMIDFREGPLLRVVNTSNRSSMT